MLEIVNQLDGFDSRGNVKAGRACNWPASAEFCMHRVSKLTPKSRAAAICSTTPETQTVSRGWHWHVMPEML